MAELFPITDTEMEAIRSVERWIGNEMQKDFNAPSLPIQDDVAILSRLLYRLAPAPRVEEVASRPGDWAKDLAAPDNGTGDPRAGSPIGIVRDHPSHDEDTSTKHLIIWALLPLAKLPDTVATLVKDAVHGDLDEQCRAALAAVDAIARRRREPDADIPF